MHDRQARAFNLLMKEELYDRLNNLPGGSKVSMFSESSWIPRLNVISKSQNQGCPLLALTSTDLSNSLSASDQNSLENALQAYDRLAQEFLRIVAAKITSSVES